ncbi:MAG: transglycosylase domain-containing protein, partial [Schleiferiaceae bacterium]|nr:transglycosylase domain-containing protein [Schleiferiaceae bacterium]
MAKKKTKVQENDFRKFVKWFWLAFLSIPFGILFILLITWLGAFGPLPSIAEIADPQTKLASEIISYDGKVIGKYFAKNRTNVQYDNLSPHLVNALVATEDERYFDHSGIDIRRLVIAVAAMGSRGGASTITQQLAKNQFEHVAQNIWERIGQKFQEWIIAAQLERNFTKEEIITLYYNQFDFLNLAVGVKSAAKIYFSSSPDSLRIEQAAMLVGMCKNPAYYNPLRESAKERTKGRRNQVFLQMKRNNLLSQAEVDSLSQLPLGLEVNRAGHDKGMAQYYREYLRKYMKDWIKENPKADGTSYNLYTDGLKIFVTLDSRMQEYAESSMREHMSNLQGIFFEKEKRRKHRPFHFKVASDYEKEIPKIMRSAMKRSERYKKMKRNGASDEEIEKAFNTPTEMRIFSWNGDIDTVMTPMDSIRYYKHFYQVGLMSVEPQTGFIKAWVGGINYKYFKYDHVKQGRRQVGSTFKPFVYATAILEKKYSPCMELPNVKTCIEQGMYGLIKDWCPGNSDGKYGGMVSLKYGLAPSMNTITTYLMKQVGPRPVGELAKEMGVYSTIPDQPSIALGTLDLSVYEMVGSYTTFANKGVYTEPISVLRIEDKNGVVLADFEPKTNEVMSEADAYVILNLLKGVTEEGTGVRLRNGATNYYQGSVTGHPYKFTNEIAGKTGTTQNNSDGWFMG